MEFINILLGHTTLTDGAGDQSGRAAGAAFAPPRPGECQVRQDAQCRRLRTNIDVNYLTDQERYNLQGFWLV